MTTLRMIVSLIRHRRSPEALRDVASGLLTRANRLEGWQEA